MKISSVIFACFMITACSTCTAQLSDVLMLTLSSSNSQSDQTAVRFLPDATDSFDSAWDAYKMMNPNPTPNIYTVSDQNYGINALNNDFTEKIVALHVRATVSATYTVTAEEIGPFGSSWSIYLIDHFLNQEIDLRKDVNYSFLASNTDSYNRFSIKFIQSNLSLVTINNFQQNTDIDHIISTHQNKIIISIEDESMDIFINDLEGNPIAGSEARTTTWTFSPNKTGMYIVHLASNEHNYTKKVMLIMD